MLQQLTDRVWTLPHDEASDRPVLTYIEGDQLSVAVDAGSSPAHVREFYTAITDKGLTIPEITILTHWHWDHSFGLCATNGFTMASKKTTEKLKEVAQWAWTPEAMEKRLETHEEIPFCHEHIYRGRLRRGPRCGEVRGHQVPHGGPDPLGGGHRGHGPGPQVPRGRGEG